MPLNVIRPTNRPFHAKEANENAASLAATRDNTAASIGECNALFSFVRQTEQTAAAGPTLTFAEFTRNPVRGATVLLAASDFDAGTVRLRHGGCVFRLTEDVVFSPNAAHDFMPTDRVEYPSPPYQLGFFAAITIEADEIVVDLNGKSLSQGVEHALQQRFFALIETASAPFITGQGPSDFGALTASHYIAVKNGFLGRTSHHGIHGNNNTHVLLESLQIADFEVAGVHLNGCSHAVMCNLHVGPSRTDVPVNATYSQARFIRPHVQAIVARDPSLKLVFGSGEELTGTQVLGALEAALEAGRANVVAGRPVDNEAPNAKLFANPSGLLDGSTYGVVVNSGPSATARGVAVSGFLTTQPEASVACTDVYLDNISVEHIESSTAEIIGVSSGDVGSYGEAFQRGPVGDTLRIVDLTDDEGKYSPDVLSHAQLFVSKFASTPAEKGTSSIDAALQAWMLSGTPIRGAADIATVITGDPLYYIGGGDSMSHVAKGNVGIFLQGVTRGNFANVVVTGVTQKGAASTGAYSHMLPGKSLPGYGGTTSRGIAVAACKDITLENVRAEHLHSTAANTIGLDFIGHNSGTSLKDFVVNSMKTATQPSPAPNQPPRAYPLRVRESQRTECLCTGRCPAVIFG